MDHDHGGGRDTAMLQRRRPRTLSIRVAGKWASSADFGGCWDSCCWWRGTSVVVRGQAAPVVRHYCWLITAQPHTHTHQARTHTFRLELTADTVTDVRPARHETTADSEPVSHADTVCSLSLTCWVMAAWSAALLYSPCSAICCYRGRRLNRQPISYIPALHRALLADVCVMDLSACYCHPSQAAP